MPKIRTANGYVDVPVAAITAALNTGDFSKLPPGKINIVHPEQGSQEIDLTPENLMLAQKQGFRYPTLDEQAKFEDQDKYGDSPFTAGALGVAEGVLPVKLALKGAEALGSETAGSMLQGMNKYEELNPGAYGAGEITGVIGSTIASGGTSLLGKAAKAATIPGLVTKAGEKTFQAVGKRMTTNAAESAIVQGIKRTAPQAARDAVEGGLFGTYLAIKQIATDPTDNQTFAESFAKNAIPMALFGAAISPALAGLKFGIGKALPKSKDNFGLLTKGASFVTGIPKEKINKATSAGLGSMLFRKLGDKYDEIVPKMAYNFADNENSILRAIDEIFELSRSLKKEEVLKIMPKGKSTTVADKSMEMLVAAENKLKNMSDVGIGVYAGQHKVDQLLEEITAMKARLLNLRASTSPELKTEAFMVIDTVKKDLGRMVDKIYKAVPELSSKEGDVLSTAQNTAASLQTLFAHMRVFLENETLFGEAADAQRRINRAWSKYLSAAKAQNKVPLYRQKEVDFDAVRAKAFAAAKKAGKSDEQAALEVEKAVTFAREYEADPATFEQLIRGYDTPRTALDVRNYRRKVAARKELVETLTTAYQTDPEIKKIGTYIKNQSDNIELSLEKPIEGFFELLNDVRLDPKYKKAIIDGADDAIGISAGELKEAKDTIGEIKSRSSQSHAIGAAIAGLAGYTGGQMLDLDLPGYIIGAGGLGYAGYSVLRNPYSWVLSRTLADRLHQGWSYGTGTAGKIWKNLNVTNAKQALTYSVLTGLKESSVEDAYKSASDKLEKADSDKAIEAANDADPIFGAVVADQLRLTREHLLSTKPQIVKTNNIYQDAVMPSRRDMLAWLGRVDVAKRGEVAILDMVRANKLTAEAVDTFKTVYPREYGATVQKARDILIETKDRALKAQLGMLINEPVGASVKQKPVKQPKRLVGGARATALSKYARNQATSLQKQEQ